MTETPNPTTDSGPDDDPDRRGQGSLILALVVVGVVVAGGITALIANHSNNDSQQAGPAPTTISAPTSTSAPGAFGFDIPVVDDFGRRVDIPKNPDGQVLPQESTPHTPADVDWLTAAPAGTQGPGGWQRVHGVVVPFSTSDGPTRIQDGLATGWSHTPQGCALASVYILYQEVAQPSNRLLRDRNVAYSPEQRAQVEAAWNSGKVATTAPDTVTRWAVAPDAYKIISYDDDLCVLHWATKARADAAGGKQWLSSELAMVWANGTWMRRPPPGDPFALPKDIVPSLAGWTTW